MFLTSFVESINNLTGQNKTAIVLVPEIKASEFEAFVKGYDKMYRSEFSDTEPAGQRSCQPAGNGHIDMGCSQ